MITFIRRNYLLIAVLIIGIVLLAAAVLIAQNNSMKQQASKQQAENTNTVAANITEFKKSLESPAPFAALPPAEQTATLQIKAREFGLPASTDDPSPVAIAEACIRDKSRELSVITRELGEPTGEQRHALNAAVHEIQDYCYKKYTPEGEMPHDMMPKSMAH
jgi:hypothetical protein